MARHMTNSARADLGYLNAELNRLKEREAAIDDQISVLMAESATIRVQLERVEGEIAEASE